jgi:PAS domain S-box-containing protein
MHLSVLLLAATDEVMQPVLSELERGAYVARWERVTTVAVLEAQLGKQRWDVLFVSDALDGLDVRVLLQLVRQYQVDLPVLLLSDNADVQHVVAMMKSGVQDYLLWSQLHERLLPALVDALVWAGQQRDRQREAEAGQRQRAQELREQGALHEREQRYREITELISDAVYSLRIEQDGRLVHEWGAETFKKITGYDADEIDINNWHRLLHPGDFAVMQQRLEQLNAQQSVISEYRLVTNTGAVRWVRDHGRPVWDVHLGRLVRIYGAVQDITEQKKVEASLQRAMRAYRTLSECNQAVVHARDEAQLLERVCQAIVQAGDYRLAWVGFVQGREGNGQQVGLVAKAGDERDSPTLRYWAERQLESGMHAWVNSSTFVDDTSPCLVVRYCDADRAQQSAHLHDMQDDGDSSPAIQESVCVTERILSPNSAVASAIFLPLYEQERVFGFLHIESVHADDFDAQEVELMQEMAGDLTYGLLALRTRAEHAQAEQELAVYREKLEHLVDQRTEELRQSEERLRMLVQTMPVLVDAFDEAGNIVLWNDTCVRVTGYTAEEIVDNQRAMELLYPDPSYREEVLHALSAIGTSRREAERDITCKDGSVKTIAWVSVPHHIRIPGWSLWAIGIDVTERRKAEEALREREALYRLLADNATDMISRHALDESGTYLYASPACETLLGYIPEELVGQSSYAFFHPDDVKKVRTIHYTTRSMPSTTTGVYRIRRKDGRYIWFETTGRVIRDADTGEPLEIIAVSRDITERKQMEESLRQSEERFRLLAENARDIIFRYRLIPVAGHDYISPSVTTILGYTPDEYYADPSLSLKITHPADKPVLEAFALAPQEYTRPLVLRLLRKDGVYVWIEQRHWLVVDESGQIEALEGVAFDITERKQAEFQITHLNEMLAQRARELETANVELEAFSHSVAHDLRSPLWTIDLSNQALLEEYAVQIGSDGRRYLQRIANCTRRMQHLIDDLLKLSHVTAGDLQFERVNLSEIARDIIAEFTQREPERVVEVTIAEGIEVEGDAQLLRIVLENLLSNAWKFTARRVRSFIEMGQVQEAGSALQTPILFIRDNGVGFAMEANHKLFAAFQRLHEKSEFPGTGVGLATVRRIIQRHEGTVWAEGMPGQGATFYFTLGSRAGAEQMVFPSSKATELPDLQHAYTRLEEVNRQVQRSRDLLRAIFDGINDGLVLIHKSGEVLAANQAIASLFGRPPEALMHHSWEELCQEGTGAEGQSGAGFPGRWVLSVFADGKSRQQRESYEGPDGITHMLAMHAFSVHFPGKGESLPQYSDQVVLHVVDVTETMKMEALMMENERLATGRKLTEIVAHEVNTPLQTILFSLELIPDASEEERELFVQRTRQQIERIGMILHQLKDVYLPSSDAYDLFDVSTLIEHVLMLTSGRLMKQHIQVERDMPVGVPAVHGSADQLKYVLLNILFNAIEAMPDGGILGIACHGEIGEDMVPESGERVAEHGEQMAYLCIEITDTGMGIEPDVQRHIFEPFFTTRQNGSGLGLFVAQKIVTQHGGKLRIDSEVGKGTRCQVLLPAVQP